MDILKVKDGSGNWVSIPAIKGDTGAKGDKGSDYIITATDYAAIALVVYNNYMTDATNVGY